MTTDTIARIISLLFILGILGQIGGRIVAWAEKPRPRASLRKRLISASAILLFGFALLLIQGLY